MTRISLIAAAALVLSSLSPVSAQSCMGSSIPGLYAEMTASVNFAPPVWNMPVAINPSETLDLYLQHAGPLNNQPYYLILEVLPTGMSPLPFSQDVCLNPLGTSAILIPGTTSIEATNVWSSTYPGGLAGSSAHFQAVIALGGSVPYVASSVMEVRLQ